MKQYKIIKPVLNFFILIYFASCSTTYEVTTRSELLDPEDLGEISVQTKDGNKYLLQNYVLKDSILICKGKIYSGKKTADFKDSLKISDIKNIQATKSNAGKIILITGVSASMLAIALMVMNNRENGLTNEIQYGCNIGDNLNDNKNRLLAAGLVNKLIIGTTESDKCQILEILTDKQTLHFKMMNEADQIELQTSDQTEDNSAGKLIIDLRNNFNYRQK